MKIRFDTYTKDMGAAASAFAALYNHCTDLTVAKNEWNDGAINVHGDIDSSKASVLEKALPDGTFNEDASKL